MMGHAVMMEYYHSLSDEERTRIHAEALRANPKASAQELIEVKRTALWKAIHKARKMKDHAEKDRDGRTFRGGEVVPGGQNLKNHIIFFAQSKFWLGQKNRAQRPEYLAETKFVKNIFFVLFCI